MIKLVQTEDNVYSLLVGEEKNFKNMSHPDADAKFFFKFLGQDCVCMETIKLIAPSSNPLRTNTMYLSTPVAIVRGVKGMIKFIYGRYGEHPYLEMRTLKAQCTSWVCTFKDELGITRISEMGCLL